MTNQKIEFQVLYFLMETSAPIEYRPELAIKLDPREFDGYTASKTAFETGGWLIYYLDDRHIKMQHTKHELYQAVYLRSNIN